MHSEAVFHVRRAQAKPGCSIVGPIALTAGHAG
jgi:hypothetical protein